jgi:3-deoxy-D-manno-octulosonate 8-phosphate phosphatase (KDO 8-P phosphatase)
MKHGKIKTMFEDIGGIFCTSPAKIQKALTQVRAFLFDWDGVFNEGMKYGDPGSPFGEADSMGVNLLRLNYWLQHGEMPVTGIITGATNEAAEYFAKREGLECCIRGFTDKAYAMRMFCERMLIEPHDVAFVFDDVLDLPVAQVAAVKICVPRWTSPLFIDYVDKHALCDYYTSSQGGQGAVRESCELMIALNGDYDKILKVRTEYGDQYKEFLALRKSVKTVVIAP